MSTNPSDNPSMAQSQDYQYHIIWTPELVEIKVPLAGLGRRCVAMFIDMLVFMPMVLGIIFISVLLLGQFYFLLGTLSPMLLASVAVGLFIICWCLYFGLFHGFNNGQTLGKMLVNIRVVNQRAGKVNIGSCFVRALFDLLDLILFYGSVAAYMVLTSKEEKRIADHVVGTLVILDKES